MTVLRYWTNLRAELLPIMLLSVVVLKEVEKTERRSCAEMVTGWGWEAEPCDKAIMEALEREKEIVARRKYGVRDVVHPDEACQVVFFWQAEEAERSRGQWTNFVLRVLEAEAEEMQSWIALESSPRMRQLDSPSNLASAGIWLKSSW